MNYEIEIKEEAKTALRKAPEEIRRQIGYRLHLLQQDFSGDVKKLGAARTSIACASGIIVCCLNWLASALWFILLDNGKTFTDERDRHKGKNRPAAVWSWIARFAPPKWCCGICATLWRIWITAANWLAPGSATRGNRERIGSRSRRSLVLIFEMGKPKQLRPAKI